MKRTQTQMQTKPIVLNAELRRFLQECTSCQSLAIAAWACRILRAGKMTMQDLERSLNLGFEY